MKFSTYVFTALASTGAVMGASASAVSNQRRADIGTIAQDALALTGDIIAIVKDSIKLIGDFKPSSKREVAQGSDGLPLDAVTAFLEDIGVTAVHMSTMATDINEAQPGAISGSEISSIIAEMETVVAPLLGSLLPLGKGTSSLSQFKETMAQAAATAEKA